MPGRKERSLALGRIFTILRAQGINVEFQTGKVVWLPLYATYMCVMFGAWH